MIITFGYDHNEGHFVPTHEPLMIHETWVDTSVKVPSYITKDFFIDNYYKLTFMQRFGMSWSHVKTLACLKILMTLSGRDLYIAIQLLNTKKKSSFITSCKGSLSRWLSNQSDFDHPWSGKQTRALENIFTKGFKTHHALVSATLSPISSFT